MSIFVHMWLFLTVSLKERESSKLRLLGHLDGRSGRHQRPIRRARPLQVELLFAVVCSNRKPSETIPEHQRVGGVAHANVNVTHS